MEKTLTFAKVLVLITHAILALTVAIVVATATTRLTSQPLFSPSVIANGGHCAVWSDGVLTCNVRNPSDGVASIAATIEFDCSQKVNGKRDYGSEPYRETVIVEDVPEQGWSTTVISSDGFSRFYKGIANELGKDAEKIVGLAKEGGLSAQDLTDEQRKYVERTPLDVCSLVSVSARYTNAARSNPTASILATLKTLLK